MWRAFLLLIFKVQYKHVMCREAGIFSRMGAFHLRCICLERIEYMPGIVYVIEAIVILVDGITKQLVQSHMSLGESIPIIPNIFHLTYIINRGAAFGLFLNQQVMFVGVAVVLVIAVVYWRKQIREGSKSLQVGIGLLVGGAIGNAWDRISNVGVVDFFDFRIWPIFNVADIAICVGVACIMYALWNDKR